MQRIGFEKYRVLVVLENGLIGIFWHSCYVFGGLTSYRLHFRTVLTIVFQGCIPIKWTAPEIIFGNPAGLSTKSDVYVDVCL